MDYYNMGLDLTTAPMQGRMDRANLENTQSTAKFKTAEAQEMMRKNAASSLEQSLWKNSGQGDTPPTAGLAKPDEPIATEGAGLARTEQPQQASQPSIAPQPKQPSDMASEYERVGRGVMAADPKRGQELLSKADASWREDAIIKKDLLGDDLKAASKRGDQETVSKIESTLRTNKLIDRGLGGFHLMANGAGDQYAWKGDVTGEEAKKFAEAHKIPTKGKDFKDGTYVMKVDEGGKGTLEFTEREGSMSPAWREAKAVLKEKLGRDPTNEEISDKKTQLTNDSRTNETAINDQTKKIGDAIIRGDQPPTISGFGMAKLAAPLKAYLADQGFDLATAEADWTAVKKHMGTLNSTQQLRLGQAINFTKESLPIIRNLAKEWKTIQKSDGTFVPLNNMELKLASNGAYGKKASSIATRLDAQISDLTSELGTVYKGGNSSTDESLKLAALNLKGKWDETVINDNINQIEKNLDIRSRSMKATGTAGLSAGSVYNKGTGTPKSRSEYFDALKKVNPKYSDKELNDYLDKKGVR